MEEQVKLWKSYKIVQGMYLMGQQYSQHVSSVKWITSMIHVHKSEMHQSEK